LAADRSLKNLRLRFIVLLDQKNGREKAVLRRSIAALDKKIRRDAAKSSRHGCSGGGNNKDRA
jgi:hypothetical protein